MVGTREPAPGSSDAGERRRYRAIEALSRITA